VYLPANLRFEGIREKLHGAFSSFPDGNDWAWVSAQNPSIMGICNGRSVARVGSVIAMDGAIDGVRYLSKAMVAEAGREQASGVCPMLGPITWGLGFGLHNPAFPAPSPTSMHWGGFGGSWTLMDPKAQISLGYVPNNLRFDASELLDRRLGRFWYVLHELLPSL
jgi:CubicO group peptidase (beta-lactamase class C family)